MTTKACKPTLRTTPLASTTLHVTLTDLLAEHELRHVFRNEGSEPIEAVYSFPMPLDAAFGSMQATLAGETLSAKVLPAKQANRRYDDAIADGDAAVLLEQLEPGLLCVNLGNLLPGEAGEIVLRFHSALDVADASARFSLPLVHRPRYGRCMLDDITRPAHDFAVEHPLSAHIRVRGLLATAPVKCGFAGASFVQEHGDMLLHIDHAMLDRDLVLTFDLDTTPAAHLRQAEDGEGSIGVLSFTLPLAPAANEAACDICLLLDCSGSMSGDAITQSRQAVRAVSEALQAHDHVQVIRFGSGANAMFRRPLQATERVKTALCELATTVEADMGGTDMGEALTLAMHSMTATSNARQAIILVTDGAVTPHEVEAAGKQAVREGIRIFTVAVGSSAGVDVLAPLSETTRGTLERTTPVESIDAAVMRQFRRARNQPEDIRIDWHSDNVHALPLRAAYPGDAVTAIAYCPQAALWQIDVHLKHGARHFTLEAEAPQPFPALRSWAGQQRYLHEEENREALALHYGLVTPETKAVLIKVHEAGNKAEGLPVVTPVAHMVPAGMVVTAVPAMRASGVLYSMPPLEDDFANDDLVAYSVPLHEDACAYMDIPAFQRRESRHVPAPPQLTQAQKQALATALARLLLNGSKNVSIDQLLPHIPAEHHADVIAYLKHRGAAAGRVGITLLRKLLDEGVELTLDDDGEATLALLLA